MEILIFITKFTIAFLIGYVIFYMLEIKDTSGLDGIIIKNKAIINKVFSPSQLHDIEVSFKKLNIHYNTISVFILVGIGGIIGLIVFFICEQFFPLTSMSAIIAIPLIMVPIWIIKYIANKEHDKLEVGLNDFFIQLKTALKINSDIIEALRRIQNIVLEPFSTYTRQLLTEINAGVMPEKALESFAQKINMKKFSLYINNVRYCHIYGGDIDSLTEKTQIILAETIKQKKKRVKETKSICTVLYILIFIDVYMYFFFINGNQYYLNTMVNSIIGKLILNINFVSIWGIIWLSKVVRKLDY